MPGERTAAPTGSGDSDITLLSLDSVADHTLASLSQLSNDEVRSLKHEVSTILPAGNLPGLILTGLAGLKSRRVSARRVGEDITYLFRGADLFPQALYAIMYGGPAVVLSAYQSLLALTGKDVDSAFPEGTWQFYLQFGLREDTGRHTCETTAYAGGRPQDASEVDDIAAWIMTAVYTLFDSDDLNACVWDEWITLRLLRESAARSGLQNSAPFNTIVRDWELKRPYRSAPGESYAAARRAAFERFVRPCFEILEDVELEHLAAELEHLEPERVDYQRQMRLHARLVPGRYADQREEVPLWEASIALVWRGELVLFDACARDSSGHVLAVTPEGEEWPLRFDSDGTPLAPDGTPLEVRGPRLYRMRGRAGELTGLLKPADPAEIHGMLTTLAAEAPTASVPEVDQVLVQMPRAVQPELRGLLPAGTRAALDALSRAPILINWDPADADQPLGELRRAVRRGIGDHPLTVIRTASSFVFDLSHVFFDGLWGMAIAEVMTNQAVIWCQHLAGLAATLVTPPARVHLSTSPRFDEVAAARRGAAQVAEVNAESSSVDMEALTAARAWLSRRGVQVTINDLLLLARVLHAPGYRPAPALRRELNGLPPEQAVEVIGALEALEDINPSLLIPMNASYVSPRERIFPTTFRNPLDGLHRAYQAAREAYAVYHRQASDPNWFALDEARRRLFLYVMHYGDTLAAIKAVAMRGESLSTGTLRMLAHLPPAIQSMLDQLPQRIGLMNEVIKGEEVFSNVGRVAAGSSLVRFMSAKDDGRAKRLVWGILTDDIGHMHISLRDFRPHVPILLAAGRSDLAHALAVDLVESYAAALNDLSSTLIGLSAAGSQPPTRPASSAFDRI